MNQYLTADLHFNHHNIIKYCERPFKDVHQMNKVMLHNINSMCKEQDTIYHLGDFKFWKSAQATLDMPYPDKLINANIVFIKGNHDKNNHVNGMVDYAVLTFAKTRYLLTHVPPEPGGYRNPWYDISWIFGRVDAVLAGHVHQAWKTRIYDYKMNGMLIKRMPIINVGVDVWNFRPVKIDKVHNLYLKLKREINEKI